MEEDLTRSDIISYLKKRYLQVTHLEGLTNGQLEEVYQNFAVPQPRRQPRNRQTAAPAIEPPPISLPMEVEQLAQRIKAAAMLGKKRALPVEQPSSDNKIKQIKMDLD